MINNVIVIDANFFIIMVFINSQNFMRGKGTDTATILATALIRDKETSKSGTNIRTII